MINFLDITKNQPSKFKTKNWVEINDDARGVYSINCQIKFETTKLKRCIHTYTLFVRQGADTVAIAADRNGRTAQHLLIV